MRVARIALGCVLLVVSAVVPPAGAGDENVFEDCSGLQLSLEGADHGYWTAMEKGRVVLVRACGPAGADCDHDVVTVWNGEGRKIFEAAPFRDIPEMSDGSILDAALRTPDRLVVSAVVGSTGDLRPVLAEYDLGTGKLLRVTPTGSIMCRDLQGDDEALTWCLGADTVKDRAGRNFDLVHRFDGAGELQGTSLPRSAFHPASEPLADVGRGSQRGGFLPGDGPLLLWLPAASALVSFHDDGRLRARIALPTIESQQRAHLVSSPNGAVYATLIVGEKTKPEEWTQGLYRLAADGSSWVPLEHAPGWVPMRVALVGADEEGLVLVDQKSLILCRLPVASRAEAE
jgi:hypothetical protein